MCGLELGFLFLFFHFACHMLEGVLHVLGEWAQRFIVANFSRVRRLEGLVVLHERWCLLSGLTCWIRPVLTNNVQIGVEQLCLLDLLRECLSFMCSLNLLLSGNSFRCRQFSRNVKVILHVVDFASKCCILADSADLGWVCLYVLWLDHDFAVFWVAEVLLNLLVVFHVLVGCIFRLFYVLCRPEWFLVADLNLPLTVLLANHGLCCMLERVTDRSVRWLHEENGVTVALLHRSSPDIGRINNDFFDILIWGDSGYMHAKQKSDDVG